MASRMELYDAVSREYQAFKSAKLVYCYNTGYAGKGMATTETVSAEDLESAARMLQHMVDNDNLKAGVRTAKSFSGSDANEWSILIEKYGAPQPSFNFHMAIK
jgi:hypothetical protein